MRFLLTLALVASLAIASVSAQCNGKTSPDSFVGDVSLEDNVVQFGSTGYVRLPQLKLGNAYHTFEMDAFLTAASGCLFSFGDYDTPSYIEAVVVDRMVQFRVGRQSTPLATSIGVWDLNMWQHLTIVVDNSANTVEIYLDGLRVVPDVAAPAAKAAVGPMVSALRSGFIGKCATQRGLSAVVAIDNFFITTSKRTSKDVADTLKQYFPVLPENDLVAYFGFNENGNAAVKSLNGVSNNQWVEAQIISPAVRIARSKVSVAGTVVTDTFCEFSGNLLVDAAGIAKTPFYKQTGGGYTNTLDCSVTDADGIKGSFIVNQRWDDNGAVIGVSVFSHLQHRWRVTPGPYLKVERADWGGWLQLAESIGVISEDRSAYIVGKEEFQLQISGQGWIRISLASPTSLTYQYAVTSKKCQSAQAPISRNMCAFKNTDRDRFSFEHIAMTEPMGLVPTTESVGRLPATLACPYPSPSAGGYSPFFYCWGWFLGPRVGWATIWDGTGRAWPYGDAGCCDNPWIYDTNQQGAWALNAHRGSIPANRQLPWCPPSYATCWAIPQVQDAACCAKSKYQTPGVVSSPRLAYCPITQADCWDSNQFDSRCCQDNSLKIRNGQVHPKCTVTENDCWAWKKFGTARIVTDQRCCQWDYASSSGLRYYNGAVRFPDCPITNDDCWVAPGSNMQDAACCGNSQTRYKNGLRLEYCVPTAAECWSWFTVKGSPMQKDPKCCESDAKRLYTNPANNEKLALPWCDISWDDCWTKNVIDARCCGSDTLKYGKKTDGSIDFTNRLKRCAPTVDDCWGWQTNPAKFPTRTEDQRCCEADALRYNSATLQRLDYCAPNFKDCWGFYTMGSLRDEDQRCCGSFPSYNGERLPYCAPSTPISPPPPVSPPPPPTIPVDVCTALKATDVAKYNDIVTTCKSVWGDSNYLSCVATMCKNLDPETPPVPDCRVERLLAAANPAYVLPKTCVDGCPNGCYGRGTCNTVAKTCSCKVDWTGADCSIPTNYNKCEFTLPYSVANIRPENTKVQCQPIPVTYQNLGITTMLTADFSNVTVQYYDLTTRVRDSVTVYTVKTIDDFKTRAEQFHLVVTNNDGSGFFNGQYSMTIDIVGDTSGMKASTVGQGISNLVLTANKVTFNAAWDMSSRNALYLFSVTKGAAPTFTVKIAGANADQQVLIGCQGRTGAFEVNRLTAAEYTAGVTTACAKLNTNCNAADCRSCTSMPNCGWCVETSSCQPGTATGPFVGQCFNWRKTFDSNVNRRLTVIPGFPTNPRLTDVFLRATAGDELPIEISIAAADPQTVPWDLVMFNDFTTATKRAFVPSGITQILQTLKDLPNSGIAISNLRGDDKGFNFIKMVTNPRDYTGIPDSVEATDKTMMSPETGDLDVLAALYRAADTQVNTFNLRPAARSVFLVVTGRNFVAKDDAFIAQVRQRLLDRNAAVVFAVPGNLRQLYTDLINNKLTVGRVVQLNGDFSNIAKVVPAALNRAASSVALAVGKNVDGTAAGHVANTDFVARRESYVIDGVKSPMRAKFFVPVERTASSSLTTTLYFPTYGRSVIETVATDKPVGLTEPLVKAIAAQATLIELKGRSFRNLFKVIFNITSLPASGKLFVATFDAATSRWVKSGSFGPANGEIQASMLPVTVPFDNIMYQSGSANDEGANFANFAYNVIDGCTESAAYTVTIDVHASNRPPVAEMPAPRGFEGVPMLLTLGGSDPDSDVIEYTITRGLSEFGESVADRATYPIGHFCAWTAAFTANPESFATTCAKITAFPYKIDTNSVNKIVYVPPVYGHSFADPATRPELLLIPCFQYKTQETTGNLKSSAPLDVQIILDHVNQVPFVWGNPMTNVPAIFKYNFAAAAVKADMECYAAFGGRTCTWKEDFGEEYWWNAGYRYIGVGGYDIEWSSLTAEITAVDCPAGAILRPWYDDSNNIKVGTLLPKLPSGTLTPVIKFRPAKEAHSLTSTTPYCSFSYRVRDSEGALSDSVAKVDIIITDVNKPPRMSKQVMDVVAYETKPKMFSLDAEDPEGDAFNGFLVGCTTKKGKLFICLDYKKDCQNMANTANFQTLNCAAIPASGLQLTKTANAPAGIEFIGTFVSEKLATPSEGFKYESAFFEFRDSSVFQFQKFIVNFNVIKINSAPVIYMSNADNVEQSESAYTASLTMGAAWSGKFRVADEDIGFGTMDLNVTIDDTLAATVAFDLIALSKAEGLAKGLRVQQPRRIEFSGSLAAINKLLASLSVSFPDMRYFPETGFATAVVKISVDDNGFSGQCPDATSPSVRTCPLSDDVTVTVNWAKAGDNNQVTVAASASAAAFAGIAAIAAAVLFRVMNRKAEEQYAPWDAEESDEGVVSNPLYHDNGMSGDNPLFEGGNDKL